VQAGPADAGIRTILRQAANAGAGQPERRREGARRAARSRSAGRGRPALFKKDQSARLPHLKSSQAASRWTHSDAMKKNVINFFLIFHIVAIACWSLPFSNPLTGAIRQAVAPYFIWSGLFQSWDMFSPSPRMVNSYVEAIVLYQGGNTEVWKFPRMEQLSLTQRYFKERYRKFVENLQEEKNAALWPDAARYIARWNRSRAAPVKMVFLVRYWSDIVPGKQTPLNADEFYGYRLTREDFK
jgi:hypothetical protein